MNMNYTEVQEGYSAHQEGLGISDNPYVIQDDYLRANRWLAGHIQRAALTKISTLSVTTLCLLVDGVVMSDTVEAQQHFIDALNVLLNRDQEN